MEKKINIAELLKDCPKGMKLYSPLCGECRVIKIYDSLGFDVVNGNDDVFTFSYDGRYNLMGECCIFPSKDNKDWSTFQRPFKDGDIVATSSGGWIGITTGGKSGEFMPTYCVITGDGEFEVYFNKKEKWQFHRLATKEEKAKLFQTIKDNGYLWNAETKTLEKLINRNKFTIGAIVTNGKIKGKICSRDVDSYKLEDGTYIFFNEVHNWKLVPNKFDITTLKPFDKVLCRDKDNEVWSANIYSHYNSRSDRPFVCIGWNELNAYVTCIPYNDETKHLLGTTNDCDEFYKNW